MRVVTRTLRQLRVVSTDVRRNAALQLLLESSEPQGHNEVQLPVNQVGARGIALSLVAGGLCVMAPFGARAQSADVAGLGYDRGAPNARIAVVEFGDFGCSACARFEEQTFAQFNREFIATGRVKWKFIPFVIGSFPNSEEATIAAECAADQSSFWSMHNLLYSRQREWSRLRDPRVKMEQLATELRLDLAAFRTCYGSDAIRERIGRANEVAGRLRLRGTPTFFINGREALGALPIEEWRKLIAEASGVADDAPDPDCEATTDQAAPCRDG